MEETVLEDRRTLDELESLSDEDLIVAYRNDEKRAIDLLIKRYKKLVRAKIKANYFIGVDKDDLIQEGMIGLFKAICDYNPSKETRFKSFATLCITRQLSTAFRTVSRQKHIPLNTSISLSAPVHKSGEDEDEGVTLMDVLKNNTVPTPEDELISRENLEVLNKNIYKVLSKLEWEVLSLYLQGKDYHQIGQSLGKPLKSIDNALQRIKRKVEEVYK